jgi:hypothetical protein
LANNDKIEIRCEKKQPRQTHNPDIASQRQQVKVTITENITVPTHYYCIYNDTKYKYVVSQTQKLQQQQQQQQKQMQTNLNEYKHVIHTHEIDLQLQLLMLEFDAD